MILRKAPHVLGKLKGPAGKTGVMTLARHHAGAWGSPARHTTEMDGRWNPKAGPLHPSVPVVHLALPPE